MGDCWLSQPQRKQISAQREAIARQRAALEAESVMGAVRQPEHRLAAADAQPEVTRSVSVSMSTDKLAWSREDLPLEATYAFTDLYQTGAPQEAVKVTADAAFGALATWLSEQQRLVERAFEVCSSQRSAWARLTPQRADGALHADPALHRGAHAGPDGAAHHPAG